MANYSDQKLKADETFQQYKARVMDSKSASFCGAKWYYSTIWLGSGMTTSCHHPLPHRVSEEAVRANYKALANTAIRKKERAEMQAGIRCNGCDYCWRIEDLGTDQISDRVYKTVLYDEELLDVAYNSNSDDDFDLRYLEISFDRTCNLACSYCNPAFSTTWVKDIKNNGPYELLATDAQDHYTHAHGNAGKYDHDDNNPYVEAFFKWWEAELHQTLTYFRLTGGEPLMSKHTWKLLQWFEDHKRDDLYFAINSNLISKPELIDKLITASKNISDFNVYTSCESVGARAEYIRDGFEWDTWTNNFDTLANEPGIKLHSMCTIGAISLGGLVEYLDWCLVQKAKYNKDTPTFTLNIQRFPKCQNPLVLPMHIRKAYADQLTQWLTKAKSTQLLHDMEVEQTKRLIDYLDDANNQLGDMITQVNLQKDFKSYYTQFDARRDKNFTETFPELAEWYNTL
jgi:organic radical activating enzyme